MHISTIRLSRIEIFFFEFEERWFFPSRGNLGAFHFPWLHPLKRSKTSVINLASNHANQETRKFWPVKSEQRLAQKRDIRQIIVEKYKYRWTDVLPAVTSYRDISKLQTKPAILGSKAKNLYGSTISHRPGGWSSAIGFESFIGYK